MIELTQIDDTSNKTYYITNSDGTVITITMIYLETQQFWIMNVSSPTFTLNGVRVCNGLNILKQYINQINTSKDRVTVKLELIPKLETQNHTTTYQHS